MAVCKRGKGGIQKQQEPGQRKDQQNEPALEARNAELPCSAGKSPLPPAATLKAAARMRAWCAGSAFPQRSTKFNYRALGGSTIMRQNE